MEQLLNNAQSHVALHQLRHTVTLHGDPAPSPPLQSEHSQLISRADPCFARNLQSATGLSAFPDNSCNAMNFTGHRGWLDNQDNRSLLQISPTPMKISHLGAAPDDTIHQLFVIKTPSFTKT